MVLIKFINKLLNQYLVSQEHQCGCHTFNVSRVLSCLASDIKKRLFILLTSIGESGRIYGLIKRLIWCKCSAFDAALFA